MAKKMFNRHVITTWYRSVMPNGGVWTESRSKSEILSEAKKYDGPGELRMMACQVFQEESGWYRIPWPEEGED